MPKQTNEAKKTTKLGEQFIIGLNDVEQSMGAWYTIFAQRKANYIRYNNSEADLFGQPLKFYLYCCFSTTPFMRF